MTTKEAVAKRIKQLCVEHNLAINTLANVSGVAPSTAYSILSEKSQNPGLSQFRNCEKRRFFS